MLSLDAWLQRINWCIFTIIIMLFSSLHLRLVDKSVVILEDIAISEEMYLGKKVVTQKHDNDD